MPEIGSLGQRDRPDSDPLDSGPPDSGPPGMI
jgi:hypothetical protein